MWCFYRAEFESALVTINSTQDSKVLVVVSVLDSNQPTRKFKDIDIHFIRDKVDLCNVTKKEEVLSTPNFKDSLLDITSWANDSKNVNIDHDGVYVASGPGMVSNKTRIKDVSNEDVGIERRKHTWKRLAS